MIRQDKGSIVSICSIARAKKLPTSLLRSFGVSDCAQGLAIPYRLMGGELAPRQRIRMGLKARDGFRWDSGQGEIVPYGLWKLNEARNKKFLLVVEGESDCWTLWHHDFPALGLPGSTMQKSLEKSYLQGIYKLYVWQEPDKAGLGFVEGIAKRLYEFQWDGKAFVVELPGCKDVSELHISKGKDFVQILRYILLSARPLQPFIPPIPRQIRRPMDRAGNVSDEKKRRAASYPLEELVEVKNHFMICPFHDDTRPSMWVKGFGYCFVCGKRMDSIEYLRKVKGFSFVEAVEALQR